MVIDDHVFGDFDEEIRKHLIKTNCFEGLSVEKAEQAIEILNMQIAEVTKNGKI